MGLKTKDEIVTIKLTDLPINDRYSTGTNIIKSEIIDVFETKKLVEKETKEEKIEKENISLETIDEKIMTIDDFLDDFESSN